MQGIYIGDDKVVHFTRRDQEVGTGTGLDVFLVSSAPLRSLDPCPTCNHTDDANGVVSSCLNCFLAGGGLYRFEYSVSRAVFLLKARGGTCTLAPSDPSETVVHRANYLLNNGFGCYDVFKNNCEDFAIYCKTGRLVVDKGTMSQSGQVVSIIGGPLSAMLSAPLRLVTTNIYGIAATAVGLYCASRFAADIGMRSDVMKVDVEDLTRRIASGALTVVEPNNNEKKLMSRPKNMNFLDYWIAHEIRHPTLARMAREILATPISTVTSESPFSIGGRVTDACRSSLMSSTVPKIFNIWRSTNGIAT
ncbi:hypothetical protein L6452_09535 [Arctium lappa]|uniref:Uncharacterized protein n=1 Tax=Arctium lappa TaxID=4217 RepID=A0ACB9DKM3_ARCLA|nr:hypothetical protein L6452_09535 [Arctium lappa]